MLRQDCDQILVKYKDFLSTLPNYQILGSYGRGEPEVGDLDIVFDKDAFDIREYKKYRLKNFFVEHDEKRILVRGQLDSLKIEAYGVGKKYFPSFACLMIGPHDRFDRLLKDAQDRGYYMTHFGLLKSNEYLTRELSEEICFESDEKILLDNPQDYELFIYDQALSKKRKVFNIIKSHWNDEYFFHTERSFYIEPTTKCNSNCVMCTRRGAIGADLDYKSFIYVLDRLNPLHVKFWGRGESLIHEGCWKMIDEMKKRDIIIYLTTNFNLDIDWQSITNADVIYISLHTFNEEHYKQITGTKINKVLDNIVKAKEKKLNIVLKAVIQDYNKNDIDDFLKITEKYDIKYMFTNVRDPDNKAEINFTKCRQPNFPFVAANGDLYACCMTRHKMGNIFNQDNINPAILAAGKSRYLKGCSVCQLN